MVQRSARLPLLQMMIIMIIGKFLMGFVFICLSGDLAAQIPEVDKSPLDISYAPANYPILRFQGKLSSPLPLARVIYSRPQKSGRQLFGAEIKYGELWRLGANETTEIEFFRNVQIDGKNVSKGRYSLYCIPEADRWTLVLNKGLYSWGAFSYKASADQLRVSVPVARTGGNVVEYFTMYFNENNHMVIQWSDVRVTVPMVFSGK